MTLKSLSILKCILIQQIFAKHVFSSCPPDALISVGIFPTNFLSLFQSYPTYYLSQITINAKVKTNEYKFQLIVIQLFRKIYQRTQRSIKDENKVPVI